MKYMIIENNLNLIRLYDEIGVDRIFLDLEIIGKKERQGHLDTVISSHHSIADISAIKPILRQSELLVRINPIHDGSIFEIEESIANGADILMLPMFKTVAEVETFIQQIDGRVRTCLLLETSEAMCRIDDILLIKGIDEIHIGLNDLHLAMNLDFMFELLTGGVVEYLVNKIKLAGIAYGFGGVATCKGGLVRGELILSEHVRLGSSMVILSRSFESMASKNIKHFGKEFNELRIAYDNLINSEVGVLNANSIELKNAVDRVCKTMIKS
ncbi:MAG: aldolase/citrate lyase family protein [Ostreibacterium sp.]